MNTTHQSRRKRLIKHKFFFPISVFGKYIQEFLFAQNYDPQYSGKDQGFYLSRPYSINGA